MPFYFAYGSNMDERALRGRCPKARALGAARLARHRFVIMANGYASVMKHATAEVHGVLFDLALSDVPPLDRYEDIAGGLYIKAVLSVMRADSAPCRALVYLGTETKLGGVSPPGYLQGIVAAARDAGLPSSYVTALGGWQPGSGPGSMHSAALGWG